MTEEKGHRSGLIRRKTGNFIPKRAYSDTQSTLPEKKKKSDFQHQKSNVKMSIRQKKAIDAIRRVNHLRYNYEAIQLLVDKYIDDCNENQKRLIKLLIEEV